MHAYLKTIENSREHKLFSRRFVSNFVHVWMAWNRAMLLMQTPSKATSAGRIKYFNPGDPMTTAADIFDKIEEFVGLSNVLSLTLSEEETLMSLDRAEWDRWRSLAVPPAAAVPSLLIRRLDYAIALLQRMAASSPPGANWGSSGESRV